MSVMVIGVVAGLLGAVRRPGWAGLRYARRHPTSDDPVGDAHRFRRELRRQPGWSDQKMELRKVNGFEGFWF